MDINKPVAWMDENENVIFEKNWAYPIPLYTHPHSEESVKVKELTKIVVASATCSCGKVMEVTNLQPVKELTDEQILNLFEPKYDVEIDDEMLINFARTILRKAHEK